MWDLSGSSVLALRKSKAKQHTAPVKDATHTVLFRLHKVQNQKSNRSQNSGYILWVEDVTEGELRTLGHMRLSAMGHWLRECGLLGLFLLATVLFSVHICYSYIKY